MSWWSQYEFWSQVDCCLFIIKPIFCLPSAPLSVLQRRYPCYFQDSFINQLLPRSGTGSHWQETWGTEEGVIQGISFHLSASGVSLLVTVSCKAPIPARQLVLPWSKLLLSELLASSIYHVFDSWALVTSLPPFVQPTLGMIAASYSWKLLVDSHPCLPFGPF